MRADVDAGHVEKGEWTHRHPNASTASSISLQVPAPSVNAQSASFMYGKSNLLTRKPGHSLTSTGTLPSVAAKFDRCFTVSEDVLTPGITSTSFSELSWIEESACPLLCPDGG